MLAAHRLTQIGNERILFAMLHHRETVCCLPSYPTRKASGTDICLYVCFTLDCVQFSKTDCASVRFNVDNGNKTSPWFAHIRLAYPLPKFRLRANNLAVCLS